jgi:hypothetical protein
MIASSLRWIVPAAAMAALGACYVTEGELKTESRSFSGFDSVDVKTGVNVELKQGPFAVQVAASDPDNIKIKQEGSRLEISHEGFSLFGWNGRNTVTVTAPTFVSIEADSGGDVEGFDLKLDTIALRTASGGDIELSGECKSVTADAASGGDIDGEKLKCETGKAEASSGGDVNLWVSGSASGEASSGGDIEFHGNPTSVQRDESSGGDVDVAS